MRIIGLDTEAAIGFSSKAKEFRAIASIGDGKQKSKEERYKAIVNSANKRGANNEKAKDKYLAKAKKNGKQIVKDGRGVKQVRPQAKSGITSPLNIGNKSNKKVMGKGRAIKSSGDRQLPPTRAK